MDSNNKSVNQKNIPLFYISDSTYSRLEGFNHLSPDEYEFFSHFKNLLFKNQLNPYDVILTRLASGTFNVDHRHGYLGKFGLVPGTPNKYAVKKNSRKRALRVFTSEIEANQYKIDNNADEIEFRPGRPDGFYMQIIEGFYGIDEINSESLEDCIDKLPLWIKHIKFCEDIDNF